MESSNLDKAGGRKFILVFLIIASATAALFLAQVTFPEWSAFVLTAMGFYFGIKQAEENKQK